MNPTTDPTPIQAPVPPAPPPPPWYRSPLAQWGVSIAVGFALNWLASRGITPAPLPPAPAPGVLVLTVSPPSAAPAAPVQVAGK